MNSLRSFRPILLAGAMLMAPPGARAVLSAADLAGDWFADTRGLFVQVAADGAIALCAVGDTTTDDLTGPLAGLADDVATWNLGKTVLRARLEGGRLSFVRANNGSDRPDVFVCRRIDPQADRAILDEAAKTRSAVQAGKQAQREAATAAAAAATNQTARRAGPPSFKLSELDQMPRATFQVRPQYPSNLRRLGVPGEVIVEFIVTKEGTVADAQVVQSTRGEFDQPAIEAVRKWKFQPGKKAGQAVDTHMQVPIKFDVPGGAKKPRIR